MATTNTMTTTTTTTTAAAAEADSKFSFSTDLSLEQRWSDAQFQEMARLWNLTEKEEWQMLDLKDQLSDLDHWKNDPFEVVRYLREYRCPKKALHMFRKMVEWRWQEDIDTFLDRYGDPPPLMHYLPVFLCQTLDRDGDPIYVERTGASDPYGLLCAYGIDALADYTQFIREMTTSRRHAHGSSASSSARYCWQCDYYEPLLQKRMTQFTVIMDMEGLNYRHIRGGLLSLLKRMARISQDYYAGFGKRVLIIRAPAMFEVGWNIVKHFFDPHIQELIVFASPEHYLQILDEYIEIERLPECIAPGIGKGQAMPGYFQQVHLEGGPIPTNPTTTTTIRKDNENTFKSHCNRLDSTAGATADTTTTVEEDGNENESRGNYDIQEKDRHVVVSCGSILKGQWDQEQSLEQDKTQVTVFAVRTCV